MGVEVECREGENETLRKGKVGGMRGEGKRKIRDVERVE